MKKIKKVAASPSCSYFLLHFLFLSIAIVFPTCPGFWLLKTVMRSAYLLAKTKLANPNKSGYISKNLMLLNLAFVKETKVKVFWVTTYKPRSTASNEVCISYLNCQIC